MYLFLHTIPAIRFNRNSQRQQSLTKQSDIHHFILQANNIRTNPFRLTKSARKIHWIITLLLCYCFYFVGILNIFGNKNIFNLLKNSQILSSNQYIGTHILFYNLFSSYMLILFFIFIYFI